MTLKVDGTNGVLQAYDYQVLTTGFSYTFAAGVQLLLAVPAGTLATGTVTMPASPVDGMNITITSTQQITALTISPNTGQSVVGGTTSLVAGGSQTFVCRINGGTTVWYSQNNNPAVSLGPNIQTFSSSGTFTVPAGVTSIKVSMAGAGGGGGGCSSSNRGGAGGGGAVQCISYLTGLTPGAAITVTIGTGGAGTTGAGVAGTTTSFGAYITLTAGAGGAGNLNTNTGGGAAGTISGTYTFATAAQAGTNYNTVGTSGGGGSLAQETATLDFPLRGNGGNGTSSSAAGASATGYGSGGGGANNAGTTATRSGGAGTGGFVMVEW